VTVDVRISEMRWLNVSVTDTGLGIKQEDMAKLFKFFGQVSTTKSINKSGMGLGLTISSMIIKQLGGRIDLESTPDVGSRFFFKIPISEESLQRQGTSLSPARSDSSSYGPGEVIQVSRLSTGAYDNYLSLPRNQVKQ